MHIYIVYDIRGIYILFILSIASDAHLAPIAYPILYHDIHYSYKGVSVHALERDNLLHSAFLNRIAGKVFNPDMLMFVNKAAYNKRMLGRLKGWSLVGKRCVQRRCFGCGERFSILPILTLDGIITYDIIPGSVTSEQFLQFLYKLVVCVIPICSVF